MTLKELKEKVDQAVEEHGENVDIDFVLINNESSPDDCDECSIDYVKSYLGEYKNYFVIEFEN